MGVTLEKPSFFKFIGVELTRNYVLEYDEEQYSAVRQKVYLFMKIPCEVEKFMAYGFFQCADSFLFVYTFLPFRFFLAVYGLLSRMTFSVFRWKPNKWLKPAEMCDLLKTSIVIVCSIIMSYVDTSVMYHLIKSQSVIKLYIFYNMLEVGDRLFSAFGQDIIDALFWTATEPHTSRGIISIVFHYMSAVFYVFLHSLLVLAQATILNVAINSSNRALLVIMLSNNFVEIKGSVFKKFDKNNLFQVSCSDVRERFHLLVLLSIVVLLTMKEYAWAEETFWAMMYDCVVVIVSELTVDWIKHAFITKFNELPIEIYKEYTYSLAYDIAQTHQKHAFTDHSDLVARRMGFIPLPLGVVILHVLRMVISVQDVPSCILLLVGFLCLITARILVNIYILGKACNLIREHKKEKAESEALEHQQGTTSAIKRVVSIDTATTPTHPQAKKKLTMSNTYITSPPLLSNSNVSINEMTLNENLLQSEQKLESIGESDAEYVTRSVPNIQQSDDMDTLNKSIDSLSISDENLAKKRAESEPTLPQSGF